MMRDCASICDKCGKIIQIGDFPFCPHGSIYPQPAQPAIPTVIFRSRTGKIRFPGRADTPTPRGYERIELTTQHSRDKFEREYGKQETAKLRENFFQNQANWEATLSHNKKGLESLRDMSPQGRQLYDKIQQDIANRRAKVAPSDAGFYIESSHFDSSNREGWSDHDTGWKERK